jgi:AcrR family transcriptional regulator
MTEEKELASTRPAKSMLKTTGTAATPRGDDRQTQLLQIACRFFARYGYKGTSLRDIAEEAKITKAALYYHFPNKNSLYERIVLEGLRVLVEEVTEATSHGTTAREKLHAFMLTTAQIYVRDPDLWTAGSNAFWVDEDSVPRKAAIDLRDRYEKLLRACIQQGVQAGEFKDVDPALTGRMVLSMINGLARWFRPGGRLNIVQVIDQYLDIVLGGIAKNDNGRPGARKRNQG